MSGMASAQTVRGTVLERNTGAPTAGVVVLLIDAAENPVARTLSSDSGHYRLTASTSGAYRIRTMRIGFRPFTSEPFEVSAGREITRDIDVAMIPVLLDSVKSVGRNSCRERAGTEVASVAWEQARTALYGAQISSRLPAIGATLQTYQRIYNPGSSRIREQASGMKSGFTTAAWISLSADSLRKIGYVTEDDDGWFTFYSPDVNVLLSREFQADHCLRLTKSRDNSLTGVSFEPTRERGKLVDIKGTIWLDTKSSELRSVEFRYTNVTPIQEDEGAGGQMDFSRMQNGGFAISRWSIRMPVVEMRSIAGAGARAPQERLVEVRVAGGDLIAVTLGRDTLWTKPGLMVAGVVTDSASGDRVPLARVSLAGTDSRTTADDRGRFEIRNVLPGEHTLEVRTASLDSMNAVHRATVTVEDGLKSLTIRVARADQLARALCSFDRSFTRTSPQGIILGSSRLTGDSVPPSNVLIAAEWEQMEFAAGRAAVSSRGVRRWKETRTDSKGEFRICGVPTNTTILIRASGDSAESAPVNVKIAEGQRFERTELIFDRVLARSAVFSGTILRDSTQEVIADVEVVLPDLNRSMLTNDQGRFRFADVPPGDHRVVARRVGYGPLDVKVAFVPGKTENRRIFLSKVAMLETVEVSASALPPEFEEHRRLGLGTFLTRDYLAAREHVPLQFILREVRGLKIFTPNGSRWYVMTNREIRDDNRLLRPNDTGLETVTECYADVYLDKMLVYSRSMGPGSMFDISSLSPADIEAIEYYAHRQQLPSEYNRRASICGAIVIHTRKGKKNAPAPKPPN
jgi:hypothetical protein